MTFFKFFVKILFFTVLTTTVSLVHIIQYTLLQSASNKCQ